MTQYGFMFDMNRCYACQACSIACKDWNGLEPGAEKWMGVYEWEQGTFPNIRLHALAFPCGHCEDPACAKACPNGALYKEDEFGAVLVDQDKCDGCRKCYDACPYGAPRFASGELVEKYGDVRFCEGMPAPDATGPAFLIWNPREKQPLVPYDAEEAIALNRQRGDLGMLFEGAEDLVSFDEGTVRRDELRMKHGTVVEFMRATRNDMA